MSLNYSQKPKANNPKKQPEWYQPLIPGIEAFMAQLNQNLPTKILHHSQENLTNRVSSPSVSLSKLTPVSNLNQDKNMTYIPPSINLFPPSLDILSLREFHPGKAHCQKCFAIFTHIPRKEKQKNQCPFCGVRYLVDANSEVEEHSLIRSHFRKQGLYINDIENIFGHCQKLAEIAYKVRQHTPGYSPCTGLLDALDIAQRFFHFITFGISPQFLGALKLKARRIPIRGIVSLPSDQFSLRRELQDYQNEAPNLYIKIVQPSSCNWGDLPHQKLGVVDGLLTFKGSVNLTPTAYRKAGNFYDELEVLTDACKVIDHHNRYFSPVWADLSDEYGNAIAIRNNPPIEDTAA